MCTRATDAAGQVRGMCLLQRAPLLASASCMHTTCTTPCGPTCINRHTKMDNVAEIEGGC